MLWKVIDTGIDSAEMNMRIDREMLDQLNDQPVIHFYEWEHPSITHGYFIKPEKFLNLERLKQRGIDIARRPTGGGIVFHLWDLAFSVLVPAKSSLFSTATLENYALVNKCVQNAVVSLIGEDLEMIKDDAPKMTEQCGSFCMARPTRYDVVLNGRKIAGAAQRKMKQGFLHQGTISLFQPDLELIEDVLLPDTGVLEAMSHYTKPLFEKNAEVKEQLKGALIHSFKNLEMRESHVTT